MVGARWDKPQKRPACYSNKCKEATALSRRIYHTSMMTPHFVYRCWQIQLGSELYGVDNSWCHSIGKPAISPSKFTFLPDIRLLSLWYCDMSSRAHSHNGEGFGTPDNVGNHPWKHQRLFTSSIIMTAYHKTFQDDQCDMRNARTRLQGSKWNSIWNNVSLRTIPMAPNKNISLAVSLQEKRNKASKGTLLCDKISERLTNKNFWSKHIICKERGHIKHSSDKWYIVEECITYPWNMQDSIHFNQKWQCPPGSQLQISNCSAFSSSRYPQ